MRIVQYRRPVIVLFELVLVIAANYLSFSLRFDGNIPSQYLDLFLRTLPLVIIVRMIVFIPFRLYEGLWRYTSLWDFQKIAGAVVTSTAAIYLVVSLGYRRVYPRSIILIDALLLVFFMGGIRLTKRIYRQLPSLQGGRGVLVYGAGDAGEMVVRDMKNNTSYNMTPIGFIDDDQGKRGHRIHGVRVLGTRDDLREIMSRTSVHEILIAMPNATGVQLREILRLLEPFKVPIRTLPNLRDLLDGKITVNQVRSLALEDLLKRAPIGLDPAPIRKLIEGKCVVVTGAGGSIGSELCRQIVRMHPKVLVMMERHEFSLYSIQKDLEGQQPSCRVVGRIADVTDRCVVARILHDYQPEIIFHAAAHKHVPLMELNVCEAVKNNVAGTRILAEEAQGAHVDRFILISTDKAVSPSSVMGASKRAAELVIQSMAYQGHTCFNSVRFGNVLGSSGSVVPLFLEQIRAGGPVTVTDPEMRRYFILIPEAVQLVLHAATLGDSGATYVLEMGDEFKVVELARNLIRLSGYVPNEDIAIQYTGLRPGEKLSESLVEIDEWFEPASVDKIRRVRSKSLPYVPTAQSHVAKLEAAAAAGKIDETLQLLREMIPTFQHPKLGTTRQAKAASTVN
jgi:FlaA1/EpsC-like NDP-sugar epimerase